MQSERLAKLNEISAAAINPHVPMSLHPDIISNHGATLVDAEGSGPSIDAYGAGRFALRALYDSAASIDSAHQNMLRPIPVIGAVAAKGSAPIVKMQIPVAQAPELASAMAASASRAASAVQRNIDVVDATVAKLDSFIKTKTTHPRPNDNAVVAEATQIRDYVNNLKPELRMSFLQTAVEKADAAVVFAVLNSSPFASGLNREQHEILRSFANEKFAGRETAQRAALVDIKGKIQIAMNSYAQEYGRRLPRVSADAGSAELAALKGAA